MLDLHVRLEDWLPPEHLARFVLDTIGVQEVSAIRGQSRANDYFDSAGLLTGAPGKFRSDRATAFYLMAGRFLHSFSGP